MPAISPVFVRHAQGVISEARAQAAVAGSDTEAGGVDSLTLEFNDNPWAAFLRRLDKAMALGDVAEALRLTRTALAENVFGARAAAILERRKDDIIAALQLQSLTTPAAQTAGLTTTSQGPLPVIGRSMTWTIAYAA